MGLTLAKIELSNPVLHQEKTITVICMADSGSTYLCITPAVMKELGLKEMEKRPAILADGTTVNVPYAGPVRVRFGDRMCFVGAMVMGDTCLLGAIPMEDMDLVIHPKLLKLSVNPASPEVARGYSLGVK